GLNATANTDPVWPVSAPPIGLPVDGSHTNTVRSVPAEASLVPSGLNANAITPLCLSGPPIGLPLGISQTRTLLLSPPPAAASRAPSGLNASAVGRLNCSGSPIGRPPGTSHTRTARSSPEARRVPSGLNATDSTEPVWPTSG